MLSAASVECPLQCASAATVELSAPSFSLWRCRQCGLVRTDPLPDQQALVARYDSADYLRLASTESGLRRRCEDRMQVIRPHLPTGWLFDVGAGGGTFLSVAKEAGYEVSGLDLSARWAEHARLEHGVEVQVADLREAELPTSHLDVITLWHVLEHLPDPLAALCKLRGALQPGGRLVVGVPNYGAPTVRLKCWWLAKTRHDGPRWRHLNPWEHCWHFEHESLRRCLAAGGFEPVLLRTMSGDSNSGGGSRFHRLLQSRDWGGRLLCVAKPQ
jgi:SAM-dependent methyltransferase